MGLKSGQMDWRPDDGQTQNYSPFQLTSGDNTAIIYTKVKHVVHSIFQNMWITFKVQTLQL